MAWICNSEIRSFPGRLREGLGLERLASLEAGGLAGGAAALIPQVGG